MTAAHSAEDAGGAPGLPADFRPQDPGRIHADDDLELRWWCGQLHCSEADLRDAVAAVGEHVTEVRGHLAANKPPG